MQLIKSVLRGRSVDQSHFMFLCFLGDVNGSGGGGVGCLLWNLARDPF